MKPDTLISVVIVNYNRRDDLRAALASIQAQNYSQLEIIVVDNASKDGSLKMLQAEFPTVKSIPLERNIGMDGYSVACRAAKGELLFQMDNDSLMPDQTVLSRVAAAFAQASPDTAVLATRVEEYRKGTDEIEQLRKRDTRCGPIQTDGYHSGGVAFRRCLMDKVGYYNEDVFLYGAELFVQLKVLAAGYQLLLYPDILMLHKSSGTARSNFGVYYETRNRYWLMRHYASRTQAVRFLPCMLLHDLLYIVHKKAFSQWFRALRDGFGPLPASLRQPVRSPQPLFQSALRRIAASFSPEMISRRVAKRYQLGKW